MSVFHNRSFIFLSATVAVATSFALQTVVSGEIEGHFSYGERSYSWIGEKLSDVPRLTWSNSLYIAIGTLLAGCASVRFSLPLFLAIGAAIVLLGLTGVFVATSPVLIEISMLFVGLGLGTSGFPLIMAIVGVLSPARRRLTTLMSVFAVALAAEFFLWPSSSRVNALLEDHANSIFLSLGAVLAISGVGLIFAFRKAEAENPVERPSLAEAWGQISRNSNFWIFAFSVLVVGFFAEYVATYLQSVNVTGTSDEALKVSAIIGFISYLSLISAGWFGHMFPVKRAVATLHLLSAIAMILYVFAPMPFQPGLFLSTVIGLAWLSTALLVSYLAVDIFGTRYLGLLFGAFYFAHYMGQTSSGLLTDLILHLMGEIDLSWYFTIILGTVAAYLQKHLVERRPEDLQSTMRVNRILSK